MIGRPHILIANATNSSSADAADVTTTTSVEYDFPPETVADGMLLGGFAVVAVLVVWLMLRDTAKLAAAGRTWLILLRLIVLSGLFVIALNPHQRTQKESFQPSQVVLLVDTSTSMQQPAGDPTMSSASSATTAGAVEEARWEAVRSLLAESPLVERLRETHVVDLATFDSDLAVGQFRFPKRAPPAGEAAAAAPTRIGQDDGQGALPAGAEWDMLLEPTGASTRLGDSLDKLLAQTRPETLAGVVVISDGASNVGRDVQAANRRAQKSGVPLFALGVGGTKPPVNLQVARLVAPTDVQLGDPFAVTALVQSQGFTEWRRQQGSGPATVTVELLRRSPGEAEDLLIDSQEVPIAQDGVPIEVTFTQTPKTQEEIEYRIRVRPPAGLPESRDDDNIVARTINVFDRPTRLLVMAGGPMRDYRFSVNALHRHKSMEVDVWLQTGAVGISQNAHEILFDFPERREQLFGYDVVMAFDIDWSLISDTGRSMLSEWVANEGGGLVLVAGDVFTSQLAAAEEKFPEILKLYPVVLETVRPQFQRKNRWNQPWKIAFTPEGLAAEFLQIAEDAAGSRLAWEDFPGVYRAYPTNGRKGGATVYASFSDPLSRTDAGQPVILASQRYGQGVTAYIGSPEFWRLHALDEEYFERFWIKLVRLVSEGRSKRGLQRAMIVLDGSDFGVGQTVPLRARVLTASFEPLENDTVVLDVFDPRGRPLVPGPVLTKDKNRPSEFVGDLRVTLPGRYRLEMPIPDSSDIVTEEITVSLPRLEMEVLRQDVATLRALAEDTGGDYLPLAEAADRLPELLVNKGQTFVLDQQVTELWDRRWVMFLLIGLLSVEWLSRKLMKLA